VGLFRLIFHLGVTIAIFSFVWWIIKTAINFLRGESVQSIVEKYSVKTVKYVLLANIIVLNGFFKSEQLLPRELILAGLILLLYFFSSMQRDQEKHDLLKILPKGLPLPFNFQTQYNQWGEVIALVIGIASFSFFAIFPQYSSYGLSRWFLDSVTSLENAFLIGFIFKIIGFFFLLNVIQKFVNSISSLVTGETLFRVRREFHVHDDRDDNNFDDYEEMDDDDTSEQKEDKKQIDNNDEKQKENH